MDKKKTNLKELKIPVWRKGLTTPMLWPGGRATLNKGPDARWATKHALTSVDPCGV